MMGRARGRRSVRHYPCKRPVPLSVMRHRLARLMISRYGTHAVLQAARHGNASLATGDLGGLKAWLRVIVVIERLQATKPADGEGVH